MQFFLRAKPRGPARPVGKSGSSRLELGVFPGTFNPVTLAHLALAEAALAFVEEVVLILPKILPHKDFTGASFLQRADILAQAADGNPSFSVASTDNGLFHEIAQECRATYGNETNLNFICGRDAAERIIQWNYDDPAKLDAFLRDHRLLVAARSGEFEPLDRFNSAIRQLALDRDWSDVSSTEIRRRIAQALPWEHLAPENIRAKIAQVYGSSQHEF